MVGLFCKGYLLCGSRVTFGMFLTILIYDVKLGGNLSFMAGLFLWTVEIVSDLLHGRNSLETFFE